MSSFAWQQPGRQSAQPSAAAESRLREILRAGLQHPAGSLERQRSLSRLMVTMQATGKILVTDDDTDAEALLATWFGLCQAPEHYLQAGNLLEKFNQDVEQNRSSETF